MKDVLHTNDLASVEGLRIALQAAGIDSSVRQVPYGSPSSITVSVTDDAQHERAVMIRQNLERAAAQAAGTSGLRPGVVLAIVVIVLTAMWWFLRGGGR